MPYKDPKDAKAWEAKQPNRRANYMRAFFRVARELRRVLRAIDRDRCDQVRALMTPEEVEALDDFAFRPYETKPRRRR